MFFKKSPSTISVMKGSSLVMRDSLLLQVRDIIEGFGHGHYDHLDALCCIFSCVERGEVLTIVIPAEGYYLTMTRDK